MEGLKRRLDAVPALLGHPRRVSLLGADGTEESSLRLGGARALLRAAGIREAAGGGAAAIWLGPDPAPLRRVPRGLPVLLWPSPDLGAPPPGVEGRGWLLAGLAPAHAAHAGIALPDVAHALWGLLDSAPPAGAALRPPCRAEDLAALAATAPPRRGLRRLAGLLPGRQRRQRLNDARRAAATHEGLTTARIVPSILAALLGRAILAEDAAVTGYWQACGARGAA